MTIQYIQHDGQPQYAIVPVNVFADLVAKAEMLDDIQAFDVAMVSDDESIPAEIVYRLLDGESPLKVWREYRRLTQAELSEKTGVAQAAISQIEGKRTGTVPVLKKLANALNVDIDDLVS